MFCFFFFFPQLFPSNCENVYPSVTRRSGQDDSLQYLQISIRLLTKIGLIDSAVSRLNLGGTCFDFHYLKLEAPIKAKSVVLVSYCMLWLYI